jgi:hypothetical protein
MNFDNYWFTAGDQDELISHRAPMGPWLLLVEEVGWHHDPFKNEPDMIIIASAAFEWNNDIKMYEAKYRSKANFTDVEKAKKHAEDWYAANVLLEELVTEVDDGTT